jgi:hypothetical protein
LRDNSGETQQEPSPLLSQYFITKVTAVSPDGLGGATIGF